MKRSSSVAVWAEKVLLSMFCITAERLFRPHSRKRKLLKDTEKAMVKRAAEVMADVGIVLQRGKIEDESAFSRGPQWVYRMEP